MRYGLRVRKGMRPPRRARRSGLPERGRRTRRHLRLRLRRRYIAARNKAGIRPLRFHDLRHTFGSLAISRASIIQVQAWMAMPTIKTTMRYLHP
jgi:integrase